MEEVVSLTEENALLKERLRLALEAGASSKRDRFVEGLEESERCLSLEQVVVRPWQPAVPNLKKYGKGKLIIFL